MYRTKHRITNVAIVSFILAASCRDATGPGATSSNSPPVGTTLVGTAPLSRESQFAFVRDGHIWRVNGDGTGLVQLTSGANDGEPAWSPDGRRIAFSRETHEDRPDPAWGRFRAIFVMDADGSNLVRLTRLSWDDAPTWSPDGEQIAFASLCDNGQGFEGCVAVIDALPGGASKTAVATAEGRLTSPDWSPDGTQLAFVGDSAGFEDASDIFVAKLSEPSLARRTGTPGRLLQPFYDHPAWSPDGRSLAAVRCEPVRCGVALMDAGGSGETVLVTTTGRARPAWSPDGRTIAFASNGSIQWIRVDGSERGTIVADGASPAWRP
jgi:Tol biopolymer transport system component